MGVGHGYRRRRRRRQGLAVSASRCKSAGPHVPTPGEPLYCLLLHVPSLLQRNWSLCTPDPANDGAGRGSVATVDEHAWPRRLHHRCGLAQASPSRAPADLQPADVAHARLPSPILPYAPAANLRLASPSRRPACVSSRLKSRRLSVLSSSRRPRPQFSLKQQPQIANLGHQPPPHAIGPSAID